MRNCILLAAILSGSSFADVDGPGLGELVDAETLAQIDYTVMPTGEGLPDGSGTAAEGATVFAQHCIACHGADGEGTLNDRLVGGQGSLTSERPVKTVGSYWPYATTVFDYIRRAMPLQQPGILSDDEIYAVTAYLLYRNGIIGENERMSEEALPAVSMPNRSGFSWAYAP
jgi:cytochrome c